MIFRKDDSYGQVILWSVSQLLVIILWENDLPNQTGAHPTELRTEEHQAQLDALNRLAPHDEATITASVFYALIQLRFSCHF